MGTSNFYFRFLYSWIARYDGLEVEDNHFIARGESTVTYSTYSISIVFTPKPDGGYSIDEIQSLSSAFRQRLLGLDAKSKFVHFLVRPDGIDSFFLARKIAADEMGFSTGWMPLDTNQTLRFSSRGRDATEQ